MVETLAEAASTILRAMPENESGQTELFVGDDLRQIETRVIGSRKSFEKLFEGGFEHLDAVSYVVSLPVLEEFLNEKGVRTARILVGENVAAPRQYKEHLHERGPNEALRLADLTKNSTLQVYVSRKTNHSKFYLLRKPGLVRVIITSANLTKEAQDASRQTNYAWLVDLPPGHPFVRRSEADFQDQLAEADLFMDDLLKLLAAAKPEEKDEVLKSWLASETAAPTEAEQVEAQLIDRAYESMLEEPAQPVFTMALPPTTSARKVAETLGLAQVPRNGTEASIDARNVMRRIREILGVPPMSVGPDGVNIFVDGTSRSRTHSLGDPSEVNAALENLEAYCNTVDVGQCKNPTKAKMSFYEIILYVLTSPFLHEQMKARRARFGRVDKRGPRYLYVYGNSHNGKSTLLGYALKLLAGEEVNPLQNSDFKKPRVEEAATKRTVFPLAFDDVNFATAYKADDVLKSYWERWWRPDRPMPQIILTSNKRVLPDWQKTRIKQVILQVNFLGRDQDKERLNQIFTFNNRIFEWFSFLMLQEAAPAAEDDELATARRVMTRLYEYAKRPIPDYFPTTRLELRYDPGRDLWRELLYDLKKAQRQRRRNELHVILDDDMTPDEVRTYVALAPAASGARRAGHIVIIENPGAFEEWLEGDRQSKRRWWAPWSRQRK